MYRLRCSVPVPLVQQGHDLPRALESAHLKYSISIISIISIIKIISIIISLVLVA